MVEEKRMNNERYEKGNLPSCRERLTKAEESMTAGSVCDNRGIKYGNQ